jgi:hypothetical protein
MDLKKMPGMFIGKRELYNIYPSDRWICGQSGL